MPYPPLVDMNIASNVSILIPTMNRSEFVRRALHYYASVGFGGYICLGDSSNEQHAAHIKRDIDAVQGKLNVLYRYYPTPPYTNEALCMQALIEELPTPYAAYAGDDDLLVPKTLARCAAFLDTHPAYSAAHGVEIAFGLKGPGAQGQLTWARHIFVHQLESDSAAMRWQGYIRHALSTQYYVHRKETWQRMYRDIQAVPIRYLGGEVLPCSYSALLGKIAEVEGLSCLFQVNEEKNFGWHAQSMYSLAMQPEWSQAVQGLRDSIAGEIAQRDGVTLDEAQKFFDNEFWRHLVIMLQAHYDMRYEPNNWFSAFKRRFGWLVQWVRFVRDWRARQRVTLSLAALLRPSHPYHADFMAAYRVITQPQT
jgi:glycosyltransferase domain-containing protein